MSSPNWQKIVRLLGPARSKYQALTSDLRSELDSHFEKIAVDPTPDAGGLPITQLSRPPWNICVYRGGLWEITFTIEERLYSRIEIYVGDFIYLLDQLLPHGPTSS